MTDSRFVDVFASHQFADQHAVDRRLGLELEVFERLVVGELRRLQTPIGGPLLSVDQLLLAELQQEAEMVDVLFRAPCRDLLALIVHGRQLECLEMMFQQDGALRFESSSWWSLSLIQELVVR